MIQIRLGDYYLQGSNGWTLEAHNANVYSTEKEANEVLDRLKLHRAEATRQLGLDPCDTHPLPTPRVTKENESE